MTELGAIRSTLTVCRTCRPEGVAADREPPGAELGRAAARAVEAAGLAGSVEVCVIACLSACGRACSASVAASGKFAYVIGNLTADDANDLAAFAAAHAASADGIPPWRARPERIRKNTIARVAPPGAEHPLVERPAALERETGEA